MNLLTRKQDVILPEDVLFAATQRWRVFPAVVGGTIPLVKNWHDIKTTTTDDVQHWANQYPDCNWTLATGPGSGVFGIRLSSRASQQKLFDLCEQDDALLTTLNWTYLDQRNIAYGLFRWPEGLVNSGLLRSLPSLKPYGQGDCLPIPPSILTGVPLVYIDRKAEILEFPPTLLLPQAKFGPQRADIPRENRRAS